MPSLNDDFLEEVFHETFRNRSLITWIDRKENALILEKFMLAGIEFFKIALKIFDQASSIDIWENELIIAVDFKVK